MNENPLKLSIVFLNYNRVDETRFTLARIKELLKNRHDIEVIAVDNASTDGTGKFLQTQKDWVHVIEMPENLGIASYNEGFKKAKGNYILVLDDDSHPVNSETVDRLIQHLDSSPKIGVIACRIESPNGDIVHSWHLPNSDEPCSSIAFVGCGFAIRRELFEKVDWYPPEFFLYQNEVEVAIRVLQEQYEIYYDPRCRVIHRQSAQGRTNWRRVYYPTRNTIWIIRRYFPFPSAAYLIASRLCFGLIRALESREFRWYYKAVKEAFSFPVTPQILSPVLRKQLAIFWRQNSVWHHLIGHL